MNEVITDKKLDAWNYALDNFQADIQHCANAAGRFNKDG